MTVGTRKMFYQQKSDNYEDSHDNSSRNEIATTKQSYWSYII